MGEYPITSWQISVAQILFLLPIYALIYPLSRMACKHALCGMSVLLCVYPYAMTIVVFSGVIIMAVMDDKLVNTQMVDAYYMLALIRFSLFMLLSHIWTHSYLKRHMPPPPCA